MGEDGTIKKIQKSRKSRDGEESSGRSGQVPEVAADVFAEQAGSIELLWGGRGRPSRGPKPALSLDRITRTAIALADAGGLAAVSMQRIAGELNFTKMSLYRYVPGKTELVALMIDTAMGEPPTLRTDSGWRPALREWADSLSAVLHRHPWLLPAMVGSRVMGPNELGWVESALAALADTSLDGAEKLDAVVVINGHIRTLAQVAASMGVGSTRTKSPEQVMSAALNELLLGRSDRYPALTAAVASAAADDSHDQALEFGLERIFDGLESFMTRRAAQRPEAEPGSTSGTP
ncbi:TetR/AcrR family transcriptional regulator C-terminal domain-containing protein [Streptomyces rimosus]|uniref:TetR/AcrR family transcriptional regulator C-terminal domain-containing protein n=1 Tax=Streptomyces rimosus TaxID=1927 RepID=UPI000AC62B31|nr:TetR/AcrR family transcriptional regulator C-terminal domain-containing protein [Streptomyces rimosus]